jgi:hypothetical protein
VDRLVGVSWTSKDDDVSDIGPWHLVAPDADRYPLIIRDVDDEITPVEWLGTVRGPEVLPDHQTGMSLGHVSSFEPLSPSLTGAL